jgi:hypothetical protein
MRCLLKLTIAFALAVLANVLIQPGGVGDECLFAARVYIGQNVCGMAPDDPQLLNAANRLITRQGKLPSKLTGSDGAPLVSEIFTFPPAASDDSLEDCSAGADEFACAK